MKQVCTLECAVCIHKKKFGKVCQCICLGLVVLFIIRPNGKLPLWIWSYPPLPTGYRATQYALIADTSGYRHSE